MKKLALLLCFILSLCGCTSADFTQATVIPTPTVEVTASPSPTPISNATHPTTILSAVEQFMACYDYECTELVQLGETYMTPDYMLAVIHGTYTHVGIVTEQLHLVHLDFKDGRYQVINMYPGQADQTLGFYPNVVNLNGETVIWSSLNDTTQSEQLRVYYSGETYESVPMAGESVVYRFKIGVEVTKLAVLNDNGEEIPSLTFEGDALLPLANITHSIGAQVHPMTGEVLGVCGYPKAPDNESKKALIEAFQNAGLLELRSDFSLIATKEYSGKLYTCITYTRNAQVIYELVLSELTLEGNIEVLGICEFAPPDESGYAMYSTTIGNEILCWTLLSETRKNFDEQILIDFNGFRLYWENENFQYDTVVDRFFIYMNRHTPLPTTCVPVVNGHELRELSSHITYVNFIKVN